MLHYVHRLTTVVFLSTPPKGTLCLMRYVCAALSQLQAEECGTSTVAADDIQVLEHSKSFANIFWRFAIFLLEVYHPSRHWIPSESQPGLLFNTLGHSRLKESHTSWAWWTPPSRIGHFKSALYNPYLQSHHEVLDYVHLLPCPHQFASERAFNLAPIWVQLYKFGLFCLTLSVIEKLRCQLGTNLHTSAHPTFFELCWGLVIKFPTQVIALELQITLSAMALAHGFVWLFINHCHYSYDLEEYWEWSELCVDRRRFVRFCHQDANTT